jgi:hypothetical protein
MADIRGGKRIGAAVQPADGVHIRRHGGERRWKDRRFAAVVTAAAVAAHDARRRCDDGVGSVQRSLQRSQDSQLFVRGEVQVGCEAMGPRGALRLRPGRQKSVERPHRRGPFGSGGLLSGKDGGRPQRGWRIVFRPSGSLGKLELDINKYIKNSMHR